MEMSSRFGLSLCLVLALVVCHAHDASRPATEVRFDTNRTSLQDSLVRDCSDLPYGSSSGVYLILPDLVTPTPAYCDMSNGEGWTVFQRRADITPRQDFFLAWGEYQYGFGELDGEYWWGLHHLWQLTSQLDRVYELRVDLWDWDHQTAYATYQHFTIAPETDGYRLSVVDYAGDAGDGFDEHNGMKFSTYDRDNDEWSAGNCASDYTGAWWYNACENSNLNGRYVPGANNYSSVTWKPWRGYNSLNASTMKIRPTKKL